jgi:hypothetical protein
MTLRTPDKSVLLLLAPLAMISWAHAQGSGRGDSGVAALAPIVGVWQSDTVNGISTVSNCTWTPQHSAVLCEQQISSSTAHRVALNLFTVRPEDGSYELYVVDRPGESAYQTHLRIDGSIWTYGDATVNAEGVSTRTINDFSEQVRYTWRQETRTTGGDWRVVRQGKCERLR